MRVGLSGAMPDPEDLRRYGWSDLEIRFTVTRIVEAIFRDGATLVHGSHPTFVPLIRSAAESCGGTPERKRVIMFLAGGYIDDEGRHIAEAEHDWYADIRVVGDTTTPGAPQATPRAAKKESLAQMRREMIAHVDALVCVGGRGVRPHVEQPGVAVECELAVRAGKPIYLAAGLGGFTAFIRNALPNRPYNGLTPEQDERLADTHNSSEIAQLVREGLRRLWGEHRAK